MTNVSTDDCYLWRMKRGLLPLIKKKKWGVTGTLHNTLNLVVSYKYCESCWSRISTCLFLTILLLLMYLNIILCFVFFFLNKIKLSNCTELESPCESHILTCEERCKHVHAQQYYTKEKQSWSQNNNKKAKWTGL